MLVTEEEAKTKWCPEARVSTLIQDVDSRGTGVGGAACNRGEPNMMTDRPVCYTSGCMAWRWEPEGFGPHTKNEPRRGFCGKAGVPFELR